ncbi:hypothetical protein [Oceanicaulis sp.]|uniref:hypothetical protein n=1 Tax=Oceanicaulis sp. TaxID=1924941 RepID=UPI003BA965B0
MRQTCRLFMALALSLFGAPALAVQDVNPTALAAQMIALCETALGSEGLDGAERDSGGRIEPFAFPVNDRDISLSDRALILPAAEGLSLWLSERDSQPVCVMGAQNDNLGVVREVEARLRAQGRTVAHTTVNVSMGLMRRGNAVRVVELAAER